MTFQHIRYETADGIARLTLCDPERMNAYTSAMCWEMSDAIADFGRDDDQKVLILTGEGDAFCSGGNLSSSFEIEEADRRVLGHGMVMREGMHEVMLSLRRLDKPTISMIPGPAVAGGLALALCTDFRIASDRAKLGDPSGRSGLLPDEGGAWLFPRAMGLEPALRMSLLNEVYDAATAKELGLVGEVVPHDELEQRVSEMARTLSTRAPLQVRMVKRLMYQGLDSSFDQGLREAELAVLVVNDSEDVQEGIAAFLEKRDPVYKGR